MIRIKRAYDLPATSDGARVLVDRLWPRGCTRETLALETWAKEAAPSHALRKAFHSGALGFDAFADRYRQELAQPEGRAALDALEGLASQGPLTLVTATRDETQNHAQVLQAVLESHRKQEQA